MSVKKTMNAIRQKMRPIKLPTGEKTSVSTQFGALCYRVRNGKVQILLVTSRGTGRWIVPKGWPKDGVTPYQAALEEAWEEAGVKGKVTGNPVGIYSYVKGRDNLEDIPCIVVVFPIKVSNLKTEYPEVDQRKRKWFSPKKAAEHLSDPELKHLVLGFDPRATPR